VISDGEGSRNSWSSGANTTTNTDFAATYLSFSLSPPQPDQLISHPNRIAEENNFLAEG
jgi:hypothetical protein